MNLPEPGAIFAGPSGWAHAQWQGLFYPGASNGNFHRLEYLSRYFNSVEITASLFAPLKPELSRLWATVVRKRSDFQFTARCWKKLLEPGKLEEKEVAAFLEGLRPLNEAGKLGAVLLEFPANFRFDPENRARLIEIRRALKGLPLVAEFRHSSWMQEEALGVLIDYHIGFCNIDQPEHSRAMPPTAFLTSPVGYVRLRGRNAPGPAADPYLYSGEELDAWVHRIRKVNRFAKRSFVVMANDTGSRSLINAFQMKTLLGVDDCRAPKELVRRFPKELYWVRPDQPLQTSLFDIKAA